MPHDALPSRLTEDHREMHAQTILQLYRQLLDVDYDEKALAPVRAAYDLARQLFVGSYRPSEKPFCAHLVGTASALASWGERPQMVLAGLLHSAYLYGEFGDRTRGISAAKRQALITRVGEEVETLVDQYSKATQQASFSFLDRPSLDLPSRDVVVLKLADLFDEFTDLGPLYSPHKTCSDGLPHDRDSRSKVLALAAELIGKSARADFARVLQEIGSREIPRVLISQKQAYYTAIAGVPELRISKTRRRMLRLAKRIHIR